MKKRTVSFWKRGLAAGMMAVMAFMLPATPLHESHVRAAEVKSSVEYIKEVKLFIKKDGSVADAENWCSSQGEGWKVLKGDQDGDLNSGADGAFTKKVGVFLCYQTTTDPDEAITDLAVMNEKGGYSEGEYQDLLKKQKEAYIDMVKNMKGMLEEFRKNYENRMPMAVKSHDFLNAYIDDSKEGSGQGLGDLLLTVDDDRLAEILLQSNGLVVLTIQEKIAAACDTAKTTWLDRMVTLGSYDKLKSAFSKNVKSGNVEAAMEMQYKENARKILDNWDDISKRIANINNFIEDNGLKGATKEQVEEWGKNLDTFDPRISSFQETVILLGLTAYNYGDKTLYEFFSKTKEQVEKDGIETLYPMAACLTKGQICALSSSVGLYQLVQEAMAASVVNDTGAGAAGKILKAGGDADKKKVKEEISETDKLNEAIANGEKVSIYEGVDRDVFEGGVAVTTDAKTASSGTESSWTDAFYKNGTPTRLTIYMGIGTAVTGLFAMAFAVAEKVMNNINYDGAVQLIKGGNNFENFSAETHKIIREKQIFNGADLVRYSKNGSFANDRDAAAKAIKDIRSNSIRTSIREKTYTALAYGFTLFFVILSGIEITMTIYKLFEYYDVKHIDIPHHMVDQKYSDTQESKYVAYKSVPDQDGNYGDINGGNARQWLALYYTRDKVAGDPILAPTEGGSEMLVKVGSDAAPGTGYTPLHMFGTDNVAQNFTYADGDKGYSYNDKNGGTYLYFSHANAVITYTDGKEDQSSKDAEASDAEKKTDEGQTSDKEAEAQAVSGEAVSADQTGTAISGGVVVLVGVVGLVVGGFGGLVIASTRRKKRPLR